MTLAIDIGNSNTKITIFKNSSPKKVIIISKFSEILTALSSEIKTKSINSIIVCSVKNVIPKVVFSLRNKCKYFLIFNYETPIPIENKYSTPQTLGLDRLAAAVGAFSLFPKKNCLIIDSGTAITIDLLSKNGQYWGGSISPGLLTRFKSLSDYTQKLPLLELKNLNPFPGRNTEDSIQNGVQLGLIYEIEGYINYLEKYYSDLHVLVTGGDHDFFVRNIKKPIFAEPNLVAKGLYRILEHNA